MMRSILVRNKRLEICPTTVLTPGRFIKSESEHHEQGTRLQCKDINLRFASDANQMLSSGELFGFAK